MIAMLTVGLAKRLSGADTFVLLGSSLRFVLKVYKK
jgi:hypothetical protein